MWVKLALSASLKRTGKGNASLSTRRLCGSIDLKDFHEDELRGQRGENTMVNSRGVEKGPF